MVKKSVTTPTVEERERTNEDKHGIQVISRAAAILRALSQHPSGLSLSAIAHETSLPRSTVQRLVDALEVEQFVESSGAGGGSRLGPALGQLSHIAHGDIVAITRPHLEVLSKAAGETVALASATGRRTILVDRIVAERELCIMVPIGASLSPHTTAAGKAQLSQLPDAAVRKLFGDKITPRTPYTKSMKALLAQLEEIRQEGFAYERDENVEGICALAVSLETFMGTYSLTIAVPTSRFEPNLPKFKAALMKCKQAIEAKTAARNA